MAVKKKKIIRSQNTRGKQKHLKLLKISGRIFAEKGYEGTGIRDIAAVAKVRPSALIYHFGSKRNLFIETLRFHIIQNASLENIFDPFLTADASSPQSVSDAIFQCTRSLLDICHGDNKVANLNGLVVCMLIESDQDVNHIFQRFGDSIMSSAFNLLKKTNPKLSDTDIFWWAHMFWSRIFYPVSAKKILLSAINSDSFTEDFIESMAWRFACQSCVSIGLPAPRGKDLWEGAVSNPNKHLSM